MCGNAEKRRSITIIKLISQENFFLYNVPLIHFTRRNQPTNERNVGWEETMLCG